MNDLEHFLMKLMGCSVTRRIKQIKQPYGGYIPPKTMVTISMGKGIEELNPEENIHPTLVGLTVDYLTRFMLGEKPENAFKISILGAYRVNEIATAQKLIMGIKGIDNRSIVNATKLSGFDVCVRAGITAYKPITTIKPNRPTINNIRLMIERALKFFERYGPKILDGFTFEGGYTYIVSSGDGDFITEDTLWDFKVSKLPIKKEHTLQLLMYWRMGLHSVHPEFKAIKYLGIYNPRLNYIYRIAVADIPIEVIQEVERTVIGYKN